MPNPDVFRDSHSVKNISSVASTARMECSCASDFLKANCLNCFFAGWLLASPTAARQAPFRDTMRTALTLQIPTHCQRGARPQ